MTSFTLFVSPAAASNGITWGVGPALTAPTTTDDRLGAGKWTGRLSGIVIVQPRWGTCGGLVRQLWSFSGDDTCKDVSQLLFEPFVNYDLDNGWYLVSDMVITYDWKAPFGDALTIPVGGGFGKLFKVGGQALNARAEAYYNVERPENAPEWTIGFNGLVDSLCSGCSQNEVERQTTFFHRRRLRGTAMNSGLAMRDARDLFKRIGKAFV